MTILVAYCSRFGSTAEIARRIAGICRQSGHVVDARALDEVGHVDGYDAVVIGSGVYDGLWPDTARTFVRTHATALASKPVWLFTVGSFGDTHPVIGSLIKKEPQDIAEMLELVQPRAYRVFAGVIALEHWPAWGRLLFRALGGRDGDNRDWDEIERWAAVIASGRAGRSATEAS